MFKVLNPDKSVCCYVETLPFSIFNNLMRHSLECLSQNTGHVLVTSFTNEDNSLSRIWGDRLVLSVKKILPEIDAAQAQVRNNLAK